MQGFFTKKETISQSRPDGKIYSCASCRLYKKAVNPRLSYTGNGKKRILNISTSLDQYEDKGKKHWLNAKGRTLKSIYSNLGVNLHEDCWNISAIQCYNGKTKITPYHALCCRKRLLKTIEKLKPHIIITFGIIPLKSLIGTKISGFKSDINIWRGWNIPDRDLKAFINPVFSPSYVLSEDRAEVNLIWEQDLIRAFSKLKTPFPKTENDESKIQIIDDLKVLESIKSGNIAFDYEGTGLRPYRKGHKIVSASVCDGTNTYSFLMPKTRRETKYFTNLLSNPEIGKIAQNMKFEDTWTKVKLRTDVKNWIWDTMLATHVLDNRKGITGLKFQTYIRFGVGDYSSSVDEFIKTTSKNSNTINRIDEMVRDHPKELLLYGGLDSYYTYKLAMLQMEEMGYDYNMEI